MINRNELIKIGNFNKLHGIKCEILFHFTDNCFSNTKNAFFICELDSIFVPFKVESYRFISNSIALIKLKNIDSIEKVNLLTHKEVFFPKKQLQQKNRKENIFSWDRFIGFTIIDEQIGKIGQITDIDETTINTLFLIEKEDEEILIPATKEMIISIDNYLKTICMKLPDGLLRLKNSRYAQ